jgi:hypothetical protein
MHKYFQLFFDLLNMISGRNEEKRYAVFVGYLLLSLEKHYEEFSQEQYLGS